ncbi:hypothetical protein BJY14_007724 [Actinomadura luteofluorescens]|uniref:ATP-dependent DNA ligase family profile domain-containing protein n=1 Tax=Actinomadura luteofluorescens TaxID=46163 RepID=A0A7Y9JKE4_9ACTN|nr:hypothetical protein [Actinomadura luteofluorescens]
MPLSSRRLKRLNAAFPEIVLAVFDTLPPRTVVDGEIVRWGRDGRLDFSALQRRHVAGRRRADLAIIEPCHYVVFDLLETAGEDLRPAPLSERRAELEVLLAGLPGTSRVVLCPQLRDVGEARLWFEVLVAQDVEGLVVKAAAGRYREGKRGWSKVKHRTTTEMIIGGVTGPVQAPRTLILGRYEHGRGRMRVVARSAPLAAPARRELAGLLTPAGDEHPWPQPLPAGWAGGASNATSARRSAQAAIGGVEAVQEGQRRTHELTEQGQRTDRFTAAVAQLGAPSPAIQLGGVHALAGLADDAPTREFRQTCIDVLCAFLRLPYDSDPGDGPAEGQDLGEHPRARAAFRGLR